MERQQKDFDNNNIKNRHKEAYELQEAERLRTGYYNNPENIKSLGSDVGSDDSTINEVLRQVQEMKKQETPEEKQDRAVSQLHRMIVGVSDSFKR